MREWSTSGDGRDMRHLSRRNLVFYLRVFSGMSSHVIGHAVDISAGGLMLIGSEPLETSEQFCLRMCLPSVMVDKDDVLLSATSRWSKQDENPEFYITGFQLFDLTRDAEAHIHRLLDDFTFTAAN